ncbi:hypothetical protein ACSSS7_003399 [Eimeria intestinalis]
MARLPPDCAICCEPLANDLAAPSTCGHVYHRTCLANWLQRNPACAQRRCPVCRRPCRTSEVIGLQFELTQPADDTLEKPEGDDLQALQVRLSMAHASIKALLEAEVARQRENSLLKGKLASLEGQLLSHVERTSRAEAAVSECRTKLVQLQASRDRVSAELLQIKREAERQAALKKYSNEASSMTQAKAVEFLRGKCGEDIDEAIRTQHGTICELQRLRVTDEVLFPSGLPLQQPQEQQPVPSRLQSSRGLLRLPKTRPSRDALRTPRMTIGPCNSTAFDSSGSVADGGSMGTSSARGARSLVERRQTVPPATAPTTPRRPCNPTPVLPPGVQAAPLKKKLLSKTSPAEAPTQRGAVKSGVGAVSASSSRLQQTEKEGGGRWRWSGAAAAAVGCLLPLLFVPLYLWPAHELAA